MRPKLEDRRRGVYFFFIFANIFRRRVRRREKSFLSDKDVDDGVSFAVRRVDGIETPTLALFKRANGLVRHAKTILWGKRLDV